MLKKLFSVLIIGSYASISAADLLEDKLASQFQKYSQAQNYLAKEIACKDKAIGREAWEKMLKLDSPFTASEIEQLKQKQSKVSKQAREQAQQKSKTLGIDLRKIAAAGKTQEFCQSIPKGAMLHVHPDGTLDPDLAFKILSDANPTIRASDVSSRLQNHLSKCEAALVDKLPEQKKFNDLAVEQRHLISSLIEMPKHTSQERFDEFQARFNYLKYLKGLNWGANGHEAILIEFLKRSKAQKIYYVELTKGCNPSKPAIAAESKAMQKLSDESGVLVRLNCAYNRGWSNSDMAREAQVAFAAAKEKGSPNVVGVDLFGSEASSSYEISALGSQRIYSCLMSNRAKDPNFSYKATMHAGELGDARNSRDAIIMGVDRLGHGVLLDTDPVALEYARHKQTPIEINLSSNLRIGSAKSVTGHPFLKFLRLGLPVSLSTDDEGIFRTSVSDECAQAIEQTDIQYSELKQMMYNSIATSFATEETKQNLVKKLDEDFASFEKAWTSKGEYPKPNSTRSALSKISNPCFNSSDSSATQGTHQVQ